jgi:hypothetical protein
MPDEEKPLTVVVALADDVKDARADIEEALREVEREAEAQGRVAPLKVEVIEEGAGFTFYSGSPRMLFDDIRERFNPDVIVAVFWKHFGTAPPDPVLSAQEECEALAQALDRPEHPPTFIFFRDESYTPRTAEERARKDFVLHFRGFFKPEVLWWFFRKRSQFRRHPHENELRRLAARLLSSHIARRPAEEGARPNTDDYPVPDVDLPEESWRLIKPKELSELRERLEPGGKLAKDTAERYFNGVIPSFLEAVSETVPRRVRVEELVEEMSGAAAAERLRVTLLIGPGGEGKSTMLHQLAVDLTEKHPGVHVIWRESRYAPLERDLIRQLLTKEGSFVIASDDAEHIAQDVFEAVEFLRRQPRKKIQFLLACRSTDWQWMGAPADAKWERLLDEDFRKVQVSRLDEEDARRIVEAWKDADALGDFAAVAEQERAHLLLAYAREKGDSYRHGNSSPEIEEGSFLGAMLKARKSKTLEGYVSDILDRLKGRAAPGGKTLRDVFAYVVALHADNLPILYQPILRHLLSCSWDELNDAVIDPLADEAATDASGWVLLARHRRIAEVARDILCGKHKRPAEYKVQRETFERQIYPELVSAAIEKGRMVKDGELQEHHLTPWNKLPRFYADQNRIDLALHIAEALADAEPEDPLPVTAWANISRHNKEGAKAVEIFRRRYPKISDKKLNKGFFTDWAAAEGHEGNHLLDAWLAGIGISDHLGEKHKGDDAPMILLSGLTSAFAALYRKATAEGDPSFRDEADAETFLRATVAASQLGLDDRAQEGLRAGYDTATSINYLRKGEKMGRDKHVPSVEPGEAINRVVAGIILAWERRWRDEQLWKDKSEDWEKARERLPAADTLEFGRLRRVYGVENKHAPATMPRTRRPR